MKIDDVKELYNVTHPDGLHCGGVVILLISCKAPFIW